MRELYSQSISENFNNNEKIYKENAGNYFSNSSGTVLDKLNAFPRFVPRQALALFLAKQELYKISATTHGSIVECGVFMGAGLFTFAQLVSIFEPYNHNRKVIGFDSFAGFPSISENDGAEDQFKKPSGLSFEHLEELDECARLHDLNRPIGQITRVELVKGDALQTIPEYIQKNAHLTISLLYLDFDLYEPTKAALENFLPRMPKGAVLAFDELNQKNWPGETMAALECCGLTSLRLRRFAFTPALSYAVIGD